MLLLLLRECTFSFQSILQLLYPHAPTDSWSKFKAKDSPCYNVTYTADLLKKQPTKQKTPTHTHIHTHTHNNNNNNNNNNNKQTNKQKQTNPGYKSIKVKSQCLLVQCIKYSGSRCYKHLLRPKKLLLTLTMGGLAYTLGESSRWELLAMRAMRCLACRCCRWYCMYMKMTMHKNTTPNVHAVMIRNLDISSMGGNVTPVKR